MTRAYVAVGRGPAMLFKVNARNRVVWASPRFPDAHGKPLSWLRITMRRARVAFFEVTLPPAGVALEDVA